MSHLSGCSCLNRQRVVGFHTESEGIKLALITGWKTLLQPAQNEQTVNRETQIYTRGNCPHGRRHSSLRLFREPRWCRSDLRRRQTTRRRLHTRNRYRRLAARREVRRLVPLHGTALPSEIC